MFLLQVLFAEKNISMPKPSLFDRSLYTGAFSPMALFVVK